MPDQPLADRWRRYRQFNIIKRNKHAPGCKLTTLRRRDYRCWLPIYDRWIGGNKKAAREVSHSFFVTWHIYIKPPTRSSIDFLFFSNYFNGLFNFWLYNFEKNQYLQPLTPTAVYDFKSTGQSTTRSSQSPSKAVSSITRPATDMPAAMTLSPEPEINGCHSGNGLPSCSRR